MSLIKNTVLYSFGNIIPQVTGFILLPVYTYYINPSEYGIVSSMEVLSSILLIFFAFGFDRAAYRFYFDPDKSEKRKELLGTLFVAMVLLSLLQVGIVFSFSPLLGKTFTTIPFTPYYIFAIFTPFFTVFSLIPNTYFRVDEKPKAFLIVQLLQFGLSTGFILFFLLVKMEKATGILKGMLLARIVMAPWYLYYAFRHFIFKINFSFIKEAVSYGWPFIPTLLVAWVLNLSDRIFIDRFVNLEQLGLYSIAYKVSMAFFIISSSYQMAFSPVFFRLVNQEERGGVVQKLRKIIDISVYFYIAVSLFIGLFSYEVAYFLFEEKFSSSYLIIRILIFSHLFSAIDGISSSLYRLQSKRSKLNMGIALLAALVNLLLNYLLIPSYGIYGAAVATVLSLAFSFTMGYLASRKDFYIPLQIVKIGFLMALSGAVLYLFTYYVEHNIIISIMFKVTLLIVFMAILFIYRKEILRLYTVDEAGS